MRILVAGGGGHIGSLTLDALRRMPQVQAVGAGRGRHGEEVRFDLRDSSTFDRTDPFDVVVCCADSHTAPPDLLARHVVARGGAFVDTSADAETCLRLLDLAAAGPGKGPGLLVVGAGAMPGISNVLAASVFRAAGGAERLELFLSWSALSGAGPGTVEVMSRGLSVPNRRYEAGELVEGPPVGRRVRVPIRGGWRLGFESGFPESAMLGRSLGVANTSTVLVLTPGAPSLALSVLASLAERGLFSSSIVRGAMRRSMRFVRGTLFGRRTTGLTMLAAADRPADDWRDARGYGVRATDAFRAAGGAAAAFATLAAEELGRRRGVVPVEELTSLDRLIDRIAGAGTVGIERFAWDGPAAAMA